MKRLMLLALVGLTLSASAQKKNSKPTIPLPTITVKADTAVYRDTVVVRLLQFGETGLVTWQYAYQITEVIGRGLRLQQPQAVYLNAKGEAIKPEDILQVLPAPRR